MSAFDDPWRPFSPLPDQLPEKQVHSIAPNFVEGLMPFDNLFTWFCRETVRGLVRSLLGVELDASGVSPLTVSAGHWHDQDQYAALPWMAPGQATLWFDEGTLTQPGAGQIDQTAETDICWVPLSIPEGCDLAFFKLRVGTQAAADIGYVKIYLYDITDLNTAPAIQSAAIEVKSPDGGTSPLPDSWIEVAPLVTTSFSSANGQQQCWVRVTGWVSAGGQLAWLSEVLYHLRPGV